ncbi:hypothetical protein [Chondrinema litorale]|uniref:hypothetical protein n=1 Tax=Chondrinema litorale TaxID=2994555 RepID=UPI0025430B1D|nr:hypothetical protein [Chondrinema litorale]UZS00242.1 hypothetical protein OQ292_40590 [Chondrinema litorale]
MLYQVMNPELNAYHFGGPRAPEWYEEKKEWILNPNSRIYGYKLVKMKRVRSGFEIKLKIFYKAQWYWKPHIQFNKFNRYFHWLFFMLWFEFEYRDIIDKIEKDHLKESQQ